MHHIISQVLQTHHGLTTNQADVLRTVVQNLQSLWVRCYANIVPQSRTCTCYSVDDLHTFLNCFLVSGTCGQIFSSIGDILDFFINSLFSSVADVPLDYDLQNDMRRERCLFHLSYVRYFSITTQLRSHPWSLLSQLTPIKRGTIECVLSLLDESFLQSIWDLRHWRSPLRNLRQMCRPTVAYPGAPWFHHLTVVSSRKLRPR